MPERERSGGGGFESGREGFAAAVRSTLTGTGLEQQVQAAHVRSIRQTRLWPSALAARTVVSLVTLDFGAIGSGGLVG